MGEGFAIYSLRYEGGSSVQNSYITCSMVRILKVNQQQHILQTLRNKVYTIILLNKNTEYSIIVLWFYFELKCLVYLIYIYISVTHSRPGGSNPRLGERWSTLLFVFGRAPGSSGLQTLMSVTIVININLTLILNVNMKCIPGLALPSP